MPLSTDPDPHLKIIPARPQPGKVGRWGVSYWLVGVAHWPPEARVGVAFWLPETPGGAWGRGLLAS